MNRSDKIKALQQAFQGNLKPIELTDETLIVGVIIAHRGMFEIVDLHPSIKASQAKNLNDLIGNIPLFT
jgi:hypothetical protein